MKKQIFSSFLILMVIILTMLIFKNVFATYDKSEITEGSKIYSIKISMPNIASSSVVNEINKFISFKKSEVKKLANKNSKELISSKRQYELIVNSEVFEYNNIVSVHIAAYSYTGGNHYVREDRMYHYSSLTSEIIPVECIESIIDLNRLSRLAYEKSVNILKEKEEIKNIDYKWIEEGTKPEISNYVNWYLTKDGLNIIFVPYQIAPWSLGEIRVNISNSEI